LRLRAFAVKINFMPPLQRRTLAICIFALSYILFYEARGQRLVEIFQEETPARGEALREHYWAQTSMGAFVLVIGTFLICALRRKGQVVEIGQIELAVYALALGMLLGTAVVSWNVLHQT
jgi:uncharacterized membrane protein